MSPIPIQFPSDVERLRKAIDATRALDFRERIQALDGIWNAVDLFVSTAEEIPARNRLKQLREEEGRRCFREFIQQQLARQSTDPRTSD